MKRRLCLKYLCTVAVSTAVLPRLSWAEHSGKGVSMEKITHSDEQWQSLLSPKAYDVLRHEGTEPAFSSPLNKEYGEGVYVCAGCALPLFQSSAKFDSGTGWPSFFQPIEGHVDTKLDFKMILPRHEYHCVRCGGHQGHVFKDGPEPTGQRWCNNGVALNFKPRLEIDATTKT
ncbi:MAG: peptide-methionine (R)-S-oxide reductase MsrB [Mariprofundaceae bacterium]|nr:peptide-methionine (R)-S-oxide reductase MsrB [Mariprofundaceae bacterium]